MMIGNIPPLPLKIAGFSTFGRYPKISVEQTWNMMVADDHLISYPGYKKVATISNRAEGRSLFNSPRLGAMIGVIGRNVYAIYKGNIAARIGTLETSFGDVSMAENEKNQIGICDQVTNYIYDYHNNSFTKLSLNFTPGYISYQNGYFISPDISSTVGSPTWRLGDGTSWPAGANNTGTFQTKADRIVACIPFPGRSNLLLVMGNIVSELWTNTGSFPFPYQKNSSQNFSYGCVNPATIAIGDTFVVWLGQSDTFGPVIMYSTGGDPVTISTDGIDFKLGKVKHPDQSYGFLTKQYGHLIYQLTFSNPEDNFTLAYDFSQKGFYNLSDENQHMHIARKMVYFDNKFYFVSFIDGNLYELSADYFSFYYGKNSKGRIIDKEIPQIRIPGTIRLPDYRQYISNQMYFLMEQGQTNTPGVVDISMSLDGGVTFSNPNRFDMYPQAIRKNQFIIRNMGMYNEFTPQFRFYGRQRYDCANGFLEGYK